jgi:tetratricopeptide (TPR) repeat protein
MGAFMKTFRSAVLSAGLGLASLFLGLHSGFAEAVEVVRPFSSEAQQARSQLVYQESVANASYKKITDEKLVARQVEIDKLQVRVNSLRKSAQASKVEIERLGGELATKQEAFVTELAKRDHDFELQIMAFRNSVDDVMSTPEGLEAVQRLNSGDFQGAKSLLDKLDKALDLADNIRRAKRKRASVTLLASGLTVSETIARYEEVTSLDPGLHWDWVELSRLYVTSGQLGKAQQAAEQAATTAINDRDKSVALHELANVLDLKGNLTEALKHYEESLKIHRLLAAQNPSSAIAQRDLSVSLIFVGNSYRRQYRDAEALKVYIESLNIRRMISANNPTNLNAQIDLSLALAHVGRAYGFQKLGAEALRAYEEGLKIIRPISMRPPPNVESQKDLSGILRYIGEEYESQGRLKDALAAYDESLTITRTLAVGDPSSAEAQIGLSTSLIDVAKIYEAQGRIEDALTAYEESLNIDRALSVRDPSNARTQSRLSSSIKHVADIYETQGRIEDALKAYEESLNIQRALAARNPSEVHALISLSLSLEDVGNIYRTQRRFPEALAVYTESLKISRELAADDPSNEAAQRNIFGILAKLAMIRASGYSWQLALDKLLEMQSKGMLTASDDELLSLVKSKAGKEASAKKEPKK